MVRLGCAYVRGTVDEGFLAEQSAVATVLDALREWASAWKGLRRGSALADYGEIDNLLECVSSYTHEVASLNAANVWSMRTVADLLDIAGADGSGDPRADADRLLPEGLKLSRGGQGRSGERRVGEAWVRTGKSRGG